MYLSAALRARTHEENRLIRLESLFVFAVGAVPASIFVSCNVFILTREKKQHVFRKKKYDRRT